MNKQEGVFMKKRMLSILFLAIVLTGCGSTTNQSQVNNDNVPTNAQITPPQKQTETSQSGDDEQNNNEQTDFDRANDLLDQADESGILVSMNGDQFELEITKFYQKNEDEESYDMAVSSDEKLSFTITSETEITVVIYDAQTQNSRIVEGSRADLQLERSVNLYGQQVGDTFIATKVIVMQVH